MEIPLIACSPYRSCTKQKYNPPEKALQDALRWSKRALELSPDEPSYLFSCGNLLYKLGQKVEAKNMITDAINKVKNPNSATAKMYEETLRKILAGKKTW